MKYNMTQLRAAKNAQLKVVTALRKAGITGPLLTDAQARYVVYMQLVRQERHNRRAAKLQAEIKRGKLQPVLNREPEGIEGAL